MANRVMQGKARKLRAQKRRYPRTMDLDVRGPRPNTAVLGEYRERAKGLALDENGTWIVLDNGLLVCSADIPTVNKHLSPAPTQVDIDRINQKFNKPLFIQWMSNPAQRIRVYFNSRQDQVIVVQEHYHDKVWRFSHVFTCIDDAYFSLTHELITWKKFKPFPRSDGTLPQA